MTSLLDQEVHQRPCRRWATTCAVCSALTAMGFLPQSAETIAPTG